MRRIIAILLALLLLPGLCACAQEEELVAPVSFYYLRAPLPNGEIIHGSADSVIAPELRESAGRETDYTYLLEIYLLGSLDPQLRSPFPLGTFLVDFKLENGNAILTLTDDFAELSGVDLSLACGCLTTTVLELTGAECVTIFADGVLIDGKDSLTFDRNSFLLFDDTVPETG